MTKRRIAAGLVALSLIAPMTTSVSVSVAQENPAPSNEYPSIPASDPAYTEAIDADGIASGAITNMDQVGDTALIRSKRGENFGGMVGGRLYSPTTRDYGTVGDYNDRLTGYTVYSQWMDKDGAVSPVYKAETHDIPGTQSGGAGSYVFHYPNWTDVNGNQHVFKVDSDYVRVRLWIAPKQSGPGGNELFTLRQSPGYIPGFMNDLKDGPANSLFIEPESAVSTGIYTYEGPSPVMYAPEGDSRFHIDSEGIPNGADVAAKDRGAVTGRVWWEYGVPAELTSDSEIREKNAATNGEIRVVTSILTDEGVVAFRTAKQEAATRRGLIKKQQELLRSHPQYIAETVAAETDEKGYYYARFNKKDFDKEFLYQFVQVKYDGEWVIQPGYSGYEAPLYTQPKPTQNLTTQWEDSSRRWTGLNVAVVPQPSRNELEIYPERAGKGDEITLVLAASLSTRVDSYIQLYGSKGEAIKRDGTSGEDRIVVTNGHSGSNLAAFTLPMSAEEGTLSARLVSNGKIIAADSVAAAPKTKVEGAPKEVEPTDADQDAGLWVRNHTAQTGVQAVDEDGNAIPVAVDPDGRISVTPGTNVDGPITLTVVDPDLRYGRDMYEIPVIGHAQGKDDNNSDRTNADIYDPQAKDQTVNTGETPRAEDSIANLKDLPRGAKVSFKDPVDTSRPGDMMATVIVTYPDGSSEEVPVRVAVREDLSREFDPRYDYRAVVKQGEQTTIPAPRTRDGRRLPAGTKFEKGEYGPNWAAVNPEDGSITVIPAPDVAPGEYTIQVIVTYPDGSSDVVLTSIQVVEADPDSDGDGYPDSVDADPSDPAVWLATKVRTVYPEVWVRPGETATSAQPFEDLTATQAVERRPATGTKYELSADAEAAAQGITINPTTGQVTVAATQDAQPTTLTVPITVTRAGHAPERTTLTVRIIGKRMSDTYAPALPPTANITAGNGVKIPVTATNPALPARTMFTVTSQMPADWIAAVDQASGTVTVYAPFAAPVGAKATVNLLVTYPDGTTDTLTSEVTVDTATPQPFYEQTQLRAGTQVMAPLSGVDTLPRGTTFTLPGQLPAGLTEATLAADGTLTLTADATALPAIATFPVTVTYPDGTGTTLTANVQVLSPGGHRTLAEDDTIPAVSGTTRAAGITRSNPTEQVSYTVTDAPRGWSIQVLADGSIQAQAPHGTAPGTKAKATIQAVYPDKSTTSIPVTITVAGDDSGGSPGDTGSSSTSGIVGIVTGVVGGLLLLLAAGVAAVGINPSILPPQVRDMIAPYAPWINGK